MLISVYITFPNKLEAAEMAKKMIADHLIACANIFPASSIYEWENEIQQEEEFILVGKSIDSKWEILQTKVQAWHSYEVPCIIRYEIQANESYVKWVELALK